MRIQLHHARLGLLDSHTRIPFRYGAACLTECPQAVVEVEADVGATRVRGYSGDCLPPLWFDKSPDKPFDVQVVEMISAARNAARIYANVFHAPRVFFRAWHEAHQGTLAAMTAQGVPALLASFGSSLIERALIDAVCRASGLTFFQCVQMNVLGIEPERVHPELAGRAPSSWLPRAPRNEVWVRQTVGLGDPLSAADRVEGDWPDDGFPVTIEDYLRDHGVRYFKIKVSNRHDHDVERLRAFAALVERYRGDDYRLTLDGNEQYATPDDFRSLVDSVMRDGALQTLWRNTLAIEQPFPRQIALSSDLADGIRALSAVKPIIIDESDGTLDAFRQALDVGYRGVSSKNCKGAVKSLLNAGLVAVRNERHPEQPLLITGEDLCSVGIIPVQADLCLAAALDLRHVERNGHHYHKGLAYLPEAEQRAALARHGDFYREHAGRIVPWIVDGKFAIGSLQCVGFGFAVPPDMKRRRCEDLA